MPGSANVYVVGAWTIVRSLVAPFAPAFVLAAGLSVVVNKPNRQRVLNPWLWGSLAVVALAVLLVSHHFVTLHRLKGAEVP